MGMLLSVIGGAMTGIGAAMTIRGSYILGPILAVAGFALFLQSLRMD